jgi:hypothetical protein
MPKHLYLNAEQLRKIPPTAKFSQFAKLRVPNGFDRYSSKRLPGLLADLGDSGDEIRLQIQTLWQEWNEADGSKNYLLTDKEVANVLRWHLRGLSIAAAVRKARVDYELFDPRNRLPVNIPRCWQCKYNARNKFLPCAVNPIAFGSDDCPDFDPKYPP